MARGYGEPRGNEYGSDDNRDRWRDDDRERSSWRGSQGTSEREDERGFFERAGEEIRSWFNDDDDRGPNRDYERGQYGGRPSWERESERSPRGQGGGWSSGSSWDRDRERSFGRMSPGGSNSVDEDRSSFGGMAQGGRGRSGGAGSRERDQGSGGYGPPRGGGSWSERSSRDRSSMSGYSDNRRGFGGFRDESDFRNQSRRSHPQSWSEANRGENESLGYGEIGNTLGGFGNQTFGSSQDDHYRSWRDRQMSQLDQDYGDYCREREQQFHSDFDSWRRNRPARGPNPGSGQGSSDELTLGGAGTRELSSGSGTATETPGESSAIGGGSLTSGSSTKTDAGTETTGAGSSGRSRNRS